MCLKKFHLYINYHNGLQLRSSFIPQISETVSNYFDCSSGSEKNLPEKSVMSKLKRSNVPINKRGFDFNFSAPSTPFSNFELNFSSNLANEDNTYSDLRVTDQLVPKDEQLYDNIICEAYNSSCDEVSAIDGNSLKGNKRMKFCYPPNKQTEKLQILRCSDNHIQSVETLTQVRNFNSDFNDSDLNVDLYSIHKVANQYNTHNTMDQYNIRNTMDQYNICNTNDDDENINDTFNSNQKLDILQYQTTLGNVMQNNFVSKMNNFDKQCSYETDDIAINTSWQQQPTKRKYGDVDYERECDTAKKKSTLCTAENSHDRAKFTDKFGVKLGKNNLDNNYHRSTMENNCASEIVVTNNLCRGVADKFYSVNNSSFNLNDANKFSMTESNEKFYHKVLLLQNSNMHQYSSDSLKHQFTENLPLVKTSSKDWAGMANFDLGFEIDETTSENASKCNYLSAPSHQNSADFVTKVYNSNAFIKNQTDGYSKQNLERQNDLGRPSTHRRELKSQQKVIAHIQPLRGPENEVTIHKSFNNYFTNVPRPFSASNNVSNSASALQFQNNQRRVRGKEVMLV